MKKIFYAVIVIVAALAISAWLLVKTDNVTGAEFKAIYNSSNEHAYSTWYLYKIDNDRYCFRYSRPVLPKQYCVPFSELSVRNGEQNGAKIGYVIGKHLFIKDTNNSSAEQQIDAM